ncbi:hypothetical protein CF336_g8202 [Tilletia laevis]|nr:hypothetical protein CF336_g8202 [Tilletia laevis]
MEEAGLKDQTASTAGSVAGEGYDNGYDNGYDDEVDDEDIPPPPQDTDSSFPPQAHSQQKEQEGVVLDRKEGIAQEGNQPSCQASRTTIDPL